MSCIDSNGVSEASHCLLHLFGHYVLVSEKCVRVREVGVDLDEHKRTTRVQDFDAQYLRYSKIVRTSLYLYSTF